jgi:hypothetical protein
VLELEHDWYLPVTRPVEVFAGSAAQAPLISVDFETAGTPLRPGKTRPQEAQR